MGRRSGEAKHEKEAGKEGRVLKKKNIATL